jgi:tetratricopeptide (TPR) repeat protein
MTSADRISFYRQKCLSCHGAGGSATGASAEFAKNHHPERQDCASCHMQRTTSSDIAHEQVTDHRIQARPPASFAPVTFGPLVSVGPESVGAAVSDRDLGLAYAQLAASGDREAGTKALQLLKAAEKNAGPDPELHAQIGFLSQLAGDNDGATLAYATALAQDPDDSFAAGNLALLKAGARDYNAAVSLWERSFLEDPVQLRSGMNLAIVQCGTGRREAALGTLDRILHFSPDHHAARELQDAIRSGRHECPARR